MGRKIFNRILRDARSFWSTTFGIVWLTVAVIYLFTDRLVFPLSIMDVAGLGILAYKMHPKITRTLDEKDNGDTFYEDDKGIRILLLLTSILILVFIIRVYQVGHREGGFFEELVSPIPISILIPLVVSPIVLLGVYVYLRGSKVDGPFHRTHRKISAEDDVEGRWGMKKSLEGELETRYRYSFLIGGTVTVGLHLYAIAAVMASLMWAVLNAGTLIILVIIAWISYDLYARFNIERERMSVFQRISKETETPVRLLFDIRILAARSKGIIAAFSYGLGIVGSSTVVAASVGFLFFTPDILESVPQLNPFLGIIFMISISLMTLTTGIYSLIVWQILMRRMPLWLTDYGNIEIDEQQKEKPPKLPPFCSLTLVLMYAGIVFVIFSASVVIALGSAIAYILVLLRAYNMKAKGTTSLTHDNYRVAYLPFAPVIVLLPLGITSAVGVGILIIVWSVLWFYPERPRENQTANRIRDGLYPLESPSRKSGGKRAKIAWITKEISFGIIILLCVYIITDNMLLVYSLAVILIMYYPLMLWAMSVTSEMEKKMRSMDSD